MIFRKTKLAACVLCASLGVSSALLAEVSMEKMELDVAGQSAGVALFELAEQSGVQVILRNGVDKSLQLAPVQGRYTVSEALEMMLEDTGLSYRFSLEDTVVIELAEPESEESADASEPDEEVVITGTLLKKVDPSAPLQTITRVDIERLGVTSAEDIVRSLPQNFSSINAATSGIGSDNLGRSQGRIRDLGGNSAANLRGLGNNTTLVLINGKRTAGSPLFEGGVVNLSNIPASAIERVEVLTDGGSSIYGSDAIAGVINFILRKDYRGAETSLRVEDSINGGQELFFTQQFGFGWDSGQLTSNLSYRTTDPVESSKLGFTSQDFRPLGGDDRRPNSDQPGRIFVTEAFDPDAPLPPFPPLPGSNRNLVLPADSDGVGVTEADFIDQNLAPERFSDDIAPMITSDSKNLSFYTHIDQQLSDTVSGYLEMNYSQNEASRTGNVPRVVSVDVPASNAFNPFGVNNIVNANYEFSREVADGLIPRDRTETEQKSAGLKSGISWDLPFGDWTLDIDTNYSLSQSSGQYYTIDSSSEIFQELLASADASEAINLFGNGSAQNASLARAYGVRFDRSPEGRNYGVTGLLLGTPFSLPGGDVRLGIGSEFRRETLDYTKDGFRAIAGEEDAITKPGQEVMAVYANASIPLVGEGNQLPGIAALELTLSLRWEQYDIERLPDDITNDSFDNTSPRLGLSWRPVDELNIRASWTEAFTAPTFSQLITVQSTLPAFPLFPTFDPFNPDPDNPGQFLPAFVAVDSSFGGNPNLKPEIAETYTLGFDWTPEYIEGLSVSATYTSIDYTDKIDTLNFVKFPAEIIMAIPEFAIRNPDGTLKEINFQPINISSSLSETTDFTIAYRVDNDWGSFDWKLGGVYTGTLEDQLLPDVDPIVSDNTNFGNERWKVNTSLSWSLENYGATVRVNHSGSYLHVNQGTEEGMIDPITGFPEQIEKAPKPIASMTTVDLTGYYDFESDWRVLFGARNLFHAKPRFVNDLNYPFDLSRIDSRGRTMYVEVKKSFAI